MSSPAQMAVFEQLGAATAADRGEKKSTADTVSAPLDGEESPIREDEQKSCRTTSIFAVAGCVSFHGPSQQHAEKSS